MSPKKKPPEAIAVDPTDKKYYVVSQEQWDAFWEMLDAALDRDYPRLRKLMEEKLTWEEIDDE